MSKKPATLLELPRRRFIRPEEWAAYIGCSRSTVYRKMDEGKLPCVTIDGHKRLLREALITLETEALAAAGL